MKPKHLLINVILFAVLLNQYIPASSVQASSQLDPPVPPVISYDEQTGVVDFIGTANGVPLPFPGSTNMSITASDRAAAVLSSISAVLSD